MAKIPLEFAVSIDSKSLVDLNKPFEKFIYELNKSIQSMDKAYFNKPTKQIKETIEKQSTPINKTIDESVSQIDISGVFSSIEISLKALAENIKQNVEDVSGKTTQESLRKLQKELVRDYAYIVKELEESGSPKLAEAKRTLDTIRHTNITALNDQKKLSDTRDKFWKYENKLFTDYQEDTEKGYKLYKTRRGKGQEFIEKTVDGISESVSGFLRKPIVKDISRPYTYLLGGITKATRDMLKGTTKVSETYKKGYEDAYKESLDLSKQIRKEQKTKKEEKELTAKLFLMTKEINKSKKKIDDAEQFDTFERVRKQKYDIQKKLKKYKESEKLEEDIWSLEVEIAKEKDVLKRKELKLTREEKIKKMQDAKGQEKQKEKDEKQAKKEGRWAGFNKVMEGMGLTKEKLITGLVIAGSIILYTFWKLYLQDWIKGFNSWVLKTWTSLENWAEEVKINMQILAETIKKYLSFGLEGDPQKYEKMASDFAAYKIAFPNADMHWEDFKKNYVFYQNELSNKAKEENKNREHLKLEDKKSMYASTKSAINTAMEDYKISDEEGSTIKKIIIDKLSTGNISTKDYYATKKLLDVEYARESGAMNTDNMIPLDKFKKVLSTAKGLEEESKALHYRSDKISAASLNQNFLQEMLDSIIAMDKEREDKQIKLWEGEITAIENIEKNTRPKKSSSETSSNSNGDDINQTKPPEKSNAIYDNY